MINTNNFEAILRSVCEDSGEFSIRRYSGRGMFGRECLAITVEDMGDIIKIMVAVGAAAEQEGIDLTGDADGARWDSMGHGTVFYWPSIPFTGEGLSANSDNDD